MKRADHAREIDTIYITCEIIHKLTEHKSGCSIKKTRLNWYEISYLPIVPGLHQLHIKVEGKHIKGSPFNIVVQEKVTFVGTVANNYLCKAVNHQKQIIIVTQSNISIFNFEPLERIRSFGSGPGQYSNRCHLAVESNDNILMADYGNNRIQKFSPDGRYITQVGRYGAGELEFQGPSAIAIHPKNSMIYVTETDNHRIQILSHDLKFYKSFGTKGKEEGQFNRPEDLVFDSTGDVYVADAGNHRVQVFTPEGKFLRAFGKEGVHKGELRYPYAIFI